MRRFMAATGPIVITLVVAVGYQASPTAATGDGPWIISLEEERQVAEFQEKAEAAGALGFYRDNATSTLVVLVPASRSADFKLETLGPVPVPVKVKVSDLDSTSIQRTLDRLEEIRRDKAFGGESLAYFFDPGSERVRVDSSLDPATLSSRLGESWRLVDYHPGGIVVPAGRFDDTEPFWGGTAIDIENWNDQYPYDCTSGFTVVNPAGQRALVTAAHCGPTSLTVLTPNTDLRVGITGPNWCPRDDGDDLMLIKGETYGASIYVGGQTGSRGVVKGADNPVVGNQYNFSGATSYEKAYQEVTSITATAASDACYEGVYNLFQLIVFTRRINQEPSCQVQRGDSGAPFYFKNSNFNPPRIYIRGMVIGYSADGNVCYAMRYTRIRDHTGYSIYTG